MMAYGYDHFNANPLTLRQPSSLATTAADDKLMMYGSDQCFDRFEDDQGIIVPQHLDPEQVSYEFPSQSTLRRLATFLDSNDDSMFDESPLTISSSSTYSDDEDSGLAGDDQFDSFIGSIVSAYTNGRRRHPTSSTSTDHMARVAPSRSHKMRRQRTNHHEKAVNNRPASASDDDDDDEYTDDDDDLELLVDDSRLSPLQIPPAAAAVSYDSCTVSSTVSLSTHGDRVVAPCSFLHDDKFVHPKNRASVSPYHGMPDADEEEHLDLPVFCNESEPIMDDNDSNPDTPAANIVTLRLCKARGLRYRRPTLPVSDEGYADDENVPVENDDDHEPDNEPPLDSDIMFLPLSREEEQQMEDEDELRTAAATRIQAVWRSYRAKKQLAASSTLPSAHRLIVDLARICSTLHQKQMNAVQQRMDALERQLEEERAMRIAFEKAVEDMTIMVDQQQTMLYDRLEQQRADLEAKAAKMEARARKEAKARMDLEQSMAHVARQVQDMHVAQQRRAKDDADQQKTLQRKLNDALHEIAQLKRQQQQQPPSSTNTSTPRRRTTLVPASTTTTTATTTTTSRQPPRPSHQPTPASRLTSTSRPSTTPRPSAALRPSSKQQRTPTSTKR